MTLKKLILAIAGGVAVLGAFLPWAAVSFIITIRVGAFESQDALTIILAILAIVCGVAGVLLNVLKEKQIKNLIKIKDTEKLPLFVGIALATIAIIAFIYISVRGTKASFGVWMIAIAAAATIVLSFLKNKELDKVVLGKPEKPEKAEKTEKKPAKKETAKKK